MTYVAILSGRTGNRFGDREFTGETEAKAYANDAVENGPAAHAEVLACKNEDDPGTTIIEYMK